MLYELARPIYDRRVDGIRGFLLRSAVSCVVNPFVAASASKVSSSRAFRGRRARWMARPSRQCFDIDRNCGLCRGRLVRLLLRVSRFERWFQVGLGSVKQSQF
jgi:hypothetical protein